jgi:hypothetical protein
LFEEGIWRLKGHIYLRLRLSDAPIPEDGRELLENGGTRPEGRCHTATAAADGSQAAESEKIEG